MKELLSTIIAAKGTKVAAFTMACLVALTGGGASGYYIYGATSSHVEPAEILIEETNVEAVAIPEEFFEEEEEPEEDPVKNPFERDPREEDPRFQQPDNSKDNKNARDAGVKDISNILKELNGMGKEGAKQALQDILKRKFGVKVESLSFTEDVKPISQMSESE